MFLFKRNLFPYRGDIFLSYLGDSRTRTVFQAGHSSPCSVSASSKLLRSLCIGLHQLWEGSLQGDAWPSIRVPHWDAKHWLGASGAQKGHEDGRAVGQSAGPQAEVDQMTHLQSGLLVQSGAPNLLPGRA